MPREKDVTITAQVGSRRAGPQGRPFLFLVLQADRPLSPGLRLPLAQVARVCLGRAAERVLRHDGPDTLVLGLPDRNVSSAHAELRRTSSGWTLVDVGSKNGTFVNGSGVREVALQDGDWIEVGNVFFRIRFALPASDGVGMIGAESLVPAAPGLATLLPSIALEFEKLALVSGSVLPVLLGGESGAGKELAARAVHTLSGRPGAFVAVNCGALPAALVESELFGYRKGAFSGALEDRPGLVRSADRGTLFLDEIGDLPQAAQATLLRVLQESEVMPLGGTRPLKVDLRLVAATHRDLAAMAEQGRFREDLLARISGFSLRLPPLRERAEDLGLLISALLRRHFPGQEGVGFSADAARALVRHRWPLNVRELEKAVMSAVVLGRGGLVERAHLPEGLGAGAPKAGRADASGGTLLPRPLDQLSPEDQALRARLVALFQEHGGNVSAVATALGKGRFQVQRWMKRLQIETSQFRK
jgi:sigma-54 dependent transcriptional regulator, acetoin dehydrogenase operon transcriptional activator AcoR